MAEQDADWVDRAAALQIKDTRQATAAENYKILQRMLKKRPDVGFSEHENAIAPSRYQGGRLPAPGAVQEDLAGYPPEYETPDDWHEDLLQGRNRYHNYNRDA